MKFVKMHGTGNDYIYVDEFDEKVSKSPSDLAIKLSHRHFGIGADGLIFIRPSKVADAEMVMYNADGSISEMCGNGLRCVAKFIHDHYFPNKSELFILTGNGILKAGIKKGRDGLAKSIRLDMGKPIFEGLKIPTTIEKDKIINEYISIRDKTFQYCSVSMGNPHCVIFVDNAKSFEVEKYGSLIENSEIFPNRVNVEFVQVVSESKLIQRTWERGSGETWACGTGAAAVCVISTLLNKTIGPIEIELLGGTLQLEYEKGGSVFLTGPAVEVFKGEVNLD